jgi:hypothetical protein
VWVVAMVSKCELVCAMPKVSSSRTHAIQGMVGGIKTLCVWGGALVVGRMIFVFVRDRINVSGQVSTYISQVVKGDVSQG